VKEEAEADDKSSAAVYVTLFCQCTLSLLACWSAFFDKKIIARCALNSLCFTVLKHIMFDMELNKQINAY